MSSTRPFNDAPARAARHTDAALLILRVIIGIVFIAHGWQKVFTMGMHAIGGGFAQMGVPMAQVMGPFISLLELIGGVLMVMGLGTRIVALLLVCDMIGAMALVHFKNGFFLPTGYEFALTVAVVCIAIALAGAGRWSVDDMIAERRADQRGL
jgi:putative oxidoreductase